MKVMYYIVISVFVLLKNVEISRMGKICSVSSIPELVVALALYNNIPDSNVYGANMGPTWVQQDPGEPHVGPMNLAIWADMSTLFYKSVNTIRHIIAIKIIVNHGSYQCKTRTIKSSSPKDKPHRIVVKHRTTKAVAGGKHYNVLKTMSV